MSTEIFGILKSEVAKILTVNEEVIGDDEALFGYGLNSFQYIMLLCNIEDIFDIHFPEITFIFDKGCTIRTLAAEIDDAKKVE